MASDLISRSALEAEFAGPFVQTYKECRQALREATAVDAIPIEDVAEMLADLFGEECCCNYNGIDEWLPYLCEHSETCPDTIGKNGCWKQFIKHWKERQKDAVD